MENNNKIVKDHVVNMSSSMIMDKSKINRYADPFMGSHHEL